MKTFIQIKELITEKIQTCYKKFIQKKDEFVQILIDMLSIYPGWVTLGVMLIIFPFNDLISITVSGSIIYLTILCRQYIKHKIEKDTLDSIDMDRFGNSLENKKSILDIINDYIENCFDRDVLFFNVIDKDDYIDTETERRLLNELLDSSLVNMSEQMRLKLSIYVTDEALTRIIARRCMMVVTIFVANHNKNIYQRTSDEKRIEI